MHWGRTIGALTLVGGVALGWPALAGDWRIASLSGKAFRLSGTGWVRVAASDSIAVGDTVKTLGSGELTLTREGVTVTISPNSRVQLSERMNGSFTDVIQTAGRAEVEVDPRRRIRLAVATPYMAAVVKGTVFTVSTFEGYSETTVARGRVAVVDTRNRLEAMVTAGQAATAGPAMPLSLSGAGALDPPEPFQGRVMKQQADGTLTEVTDGAGRSEDGKANGAGKSENGKADGKDKGAGRSENGNSGDKDKGNADNGNNGNGYGNSGNGNSGKGNSGNGNSSNGHSNNGHSNNGRSSDGHSSNGHSSNGRSSDGHSNNGHSSNGHSSNGHSNNGHSNNGRSSDGHSSNEHSSNGNSGDGSSDGGNAGGNSNGAGNSENSNAGGRWQ